jgi:hypothetical protein
MIVQTPTTELLHACDLLDEMIGETISAKLARRPDFGLFEAPFEANVILNLAIRHCEAIVTLGRTDLVLLPAASALARAVFEAAFRVRWLLHPTGDYDREARWLAQLAEEGHLWERLATIATETGEPVPAYSAAAEKILAFRNGVRAKLPKGVEAQSRVPNLRVMMRDQGEERRYITYSLLSQVVHAGHFAGSAYRRGLGVHKELGERRFARDWPGCLRIAWWSLYEATHRYVEVACEPGTEIGRSDQYDALEAAFLAAENAAVNENEPAGKEDK